MCDQQIAIDDHTGWAGGGSRNNTYDFTLDAITEGTKYEIVGSMRSKGGVESNGDVWLIIE